MFGHANVFLFIKAAANIFLSSENFYKAPLVLYSPAILVSPYWLYVYFSSEITFCDKKYMKCQRELTELSEIC